MGGNKRGSFVQEQLAQLHASELTPGQAKRTVVAFLDHYRSLYERDVQRGKQRKMDFLSSAQSALSRLKRAVLQKYGARAEEFSRGLKLGASETRALRDARERRVYAKSIDLVDIDGDEVVLRCRELLWSEDPYTVGIALAALTGRRAAELVHSLRVAPPLLDHFTHAKYWGRITGVLKQRRGGGGEEGGERAVEVPFLAPREDIERALEFLQTSFPTPTAASVNRLHGKGFQRQMGVLFPEIGNMHQFRKFYALVCFRYFNERKCSLPRLAADYLGHKNLGSSVITYLSISLPSLGKLDFKQ